MQKDIHPKYEAIKATCSCGNVVETRLPYAKTCTSTYVQRVTRSTLASRKF